MKGLITGKGVIRFKCCTSATHSDCSASVQTVSLRAAKRLVHTASLRQYIYTAVTPHLPCVMHKGKAMKKRLNVTESPSEVVTEVEFGASRCQCIVLEAAGCVHVALPLGVHKLCLSVLLYKLKSHTGTPIWPHLWGSLCKYKSIMTEPQYSEVCRICAV